MDGGLLEAPGWDWRTVGKFFDFGVRYESVVAP